jgi:hypothetical protein
MGLDEGGAGEVIACQVQHLHPCQQTWLKLMVFRRQIREHKLSALRTRMPEANTLTLALTARILENHGLG